MTRRTALLFVVAALAFGTAFVGIKAGVATIPPVLFAALRFDLGAGLLLALLVRRRGVVGALPRTRRDLLGVGIAGVFLVTLNGALLFIGQQFTTSAAAAVVYGIVPLATAPFAVVVLRDRLSPLGVVGLVLGFAGLVVVVRPSPEFLQGSGLGEALVVVAALSVAFGSVLLRRVRPSMSSFALTAWAMVVGALCSHALSHLLGEPLGVAWTPEAVAAVVWLGTVSTGLAFPAYFALIREAGPVRANLVAYVVPIVAAVSGAVVLGESIAATTALGFLVVLCGFALLEHEALRRDLRAAWDWV
ncbi:DMT family transporter [Salinigranum halophilum]|jgi:drug/metabolite transporter (DMT)-like permease|uniref:DMT family transporter n=1 Tax=Salinigranum halophilum TaxID=2565931 RepID=UPI00115DC4DD|nr:EamA family transporter [Salinigranum halophilum]